ncbi:MAG: hypothetical protein AAF846_27320 [Chloroflexota bacterium]
MPIQSHRIAKGIYHHQYTGNLTSDEFLQGASMEKRWAEDDSVEKVVIIMDCSQLKTFPMNLGKLIKGFNGNELATLVYRAAPIAERFGEIIAKITSEPIEFYDNWDEIVARAHQVLDDAKVE